MSWLDDVLLLDIFGGLRTTLKHLRRPADTVEYPEQAKTPTDRFRGMFRLDEERCIKCTLCAIECPINIIYIDWHSEKNEAGKAEKVLDRFDVDLKRCMFCGLCEEACPTKPKSIWLRTKTYELGTYDRHEALYLDIGKLTSWDANVKEFIPRAPKSGPGADAPPTVPTGPAVPKVEPAKPAPAVPAAAPPAPPAGPPKEA